MLSLVAVEGVWVLGWYATLALLRRQNYPPEIISSNDFPSGAKKFSFAYLLYHLPVVMLAVPLFGKRGASVRFVAAASALLYPALAYLIWFAWSSLFHK
jgi:hypothetical protein